MSGLDKRGDVNWFVISVVLAIMALVVFLLIFYVFPWKGAVDRSACHESIILRATLPGDNIDIKSHASLRCKSRSICISAKDSGAGDCSGLGKTYETMKLSAGDDDPQGKQQQIKMFLAREMADCWNMYGEGKLQIFSREWTLDSDTSRAIICSKIEFGKSIVYGKDGKLGGGDDMTSVTGLVNYMVTHKIPTKNISYMDYLRNTPEGDSAQQMYGNMVPQKSKELLASEGSDVVDLTKLKSIFYIETTKNNAGKIGAVAASVVVAGVVVATCPGCAAAAGRALVGAPGTSLLVVGGIEMGIGAVGDSIQNLFTSGPLKDVNAVGGLFLIDYTERGFSDFNIQSFENLN